MHGYICMAMYACLHHITSLCIPRALSRSMQDLLFVGSIHYPNIMPTDPRAPACTYIKCGWDGARLLRQCEQAKRETHVLNGGQAIGSRIVVGAGKDFMAGPLACTYCSYTPGSPAEGAEQQVVKLGLPRLEHPCGNNHWSCLRNKTGVFSTTPYN